LKNCAAKIKFPVEIEIDPATTLKCTIEKIQEVKDALKEVRPKNKLENHI
jgi:hypothetical protein